MSGNNIWCKKCKTHHHPVDACQDMKKPFHITFNIWSVLKNVCCLFLMFLIGAVIGGYYGFLNGQEFYNKWMVVSSFNSGYDTGYMAGSSQTMYMLFEDYIKSNPYKVELPDLPEIEK